MTGGRAFFDTHVLLYVYSNAEVSKQARALSLYREYAGSGRMLLSTQVVQEFFVAALRKLKLPQSQVREIVFTLLDIPLIVIATSHIRTAIEVMNEFGVSFWDALILAAAQAGHAEVVYTEDLNDGQRYGSVVARNPFGTTMPLG